MSWLRYLPITHRGLHDGNREVAENSLPAFRAAVAAELAIEFDVHLSSDGVPVVFHDETLERMTGKSGLLADFTAEQLGAMTLKANGGPIPTLRQVLDEIDGAVPLLLEVKSPKVDVEPLCEAIGRALDGYEGEFAVQSFNPMIIEWFRVHRPGFERGCTTTDYDHMDWETPEIRGLLAKAVEHEMGDPHFYAQDVNYFPNDITERAKRRNLPLVVWTVRTEEGLEKARKHGANVIFELVRP